MRDQRALDVKTAAGAQFAGEAHVELPRKTAGAEKLAQARGLGDGALGVAEPVEVIGDREMLGNIAFPRRHRVAVRL